MRDRVQFELVMNAGTSAVRNSLICKGKTQHAFLMRLGIHKKNELSRFTYEEKKNIGGSSKRMVCPSIIFGYVTQIVPCTLLSF